MSKSYRCIKTLAIYDNRAIAFTEGKLYRGKLYYKDGKGHIEAEGVSFRNNQDNLHLLPFDWLDSYFVQVPELDVMNHGELHRWLTDGVSARQLYEAIVTGREWLKNFKPEMEDDDGLVEAVKERLEMIEAAYELHNG